MSTASAYLHLHRSKKEHSKCLLTPTQGARKRTANTSLCYHDSHNLVHVQNSCKAALNMRCFNQQHDRVLARIVEAARKNVVSDVQVMAYVKDGYNFPTHVACTHLRANIVWWNDVTRSPPSKTTISLVKSSP